MDYDRHLLYVMGAECGTYSDGDHEDGGKRESSLSELSATDKRVVSQLQDNEMESLLDEIESGYGANDDTKHEQDEEDEEEEEEDVDLFDLSYVAFGIHDEEIEQQEIIIEEVLDEIEHTESYQSEHHKECTDPNCKECNEKQWQYSMLVKDDNNKNNNKNAVKLRMHKQQTFEHFLKFEKIVAQHSMPRLVANHNNNDDDAKHDEVNKSKSEQYINDTNFFYCPAKMDYLLHGYVRNIIRNKRRKNTSSTNTTSTTTKTTKTRRRSSSRRQHGLLQRIVPSVVIRLLHSFYSAPNNKYCNEMKQQFGIDWQHHRCIVQHQSCNLWRWELDSKLNEYRWKQCNGLKERGQLSLLYDEIKGFTRLVHFDKKRNVMRGLQIIESNQKMNLKPKSNTIQIADQPEFEKSILEFGGFDYMYLFDDDQDTNNEDIDLLQQPRSKYAYGEVQKFKIEVIGANHAYYARQFMKCYNNILDSEIKNEIKMLKKIELFSPKKDKEKSKAAEQSRKKNNNENELDPEDDSSGMPDINYLHLYVKGLQSRDDVAMHIKSARLIRRLLSNEHQPPIQEIIDCGIIQRLIYLMQYSPSYVVKFECAWSLTNIASGTQEHTATLIKFNGIHALINVFKKKDSIVEIKEQCLWALGNIAGDSVECRDLVLEHEILRYLLPLIRPYRMLMFKSSSSSSSTSTSSPNHEDKPAKTDKNKQDEEDVDEDDDLKRDQEAETAGNENGYHAQTLTEKEKQNREEEKKKNDALISHEISMCQRQRTFMRNLAWTLSNLNRNKPLPSFKHIILSLHAINIIVKDPLSDFDTELMQDCCWTLSYLSDHNFDDSEQSDQQDEIQLDLPSILLDSSLVDLLIAILRDPRYADQVKHPALRTIGNIARGSDELTNKLLRKPGILEAIAGLLSNKLSPIKRETLWLISNITAGDPTQIEMIVQANKNDSRLLLNILRILDSDDEEQSVKKEAVWAIANATSGGTSQQIRFICQHNAIYSLCKYMKACLDRKYYGKVLTVCIEGLENILSLGLNDALLGGVQNANNPNHFLNAVIGQNGAQNMYAMVVEQHGALDCFEAIIENVTDCDQDLRERVQNILDSYFPLRQFRD